MSAVAYITQSAGDGSPLLDVFDAEDGPATGLILSRGLYGRTEDGIKRDADVFLYAYGYTLTNTWETVPTGWAAVVTRRP